MVNIHLQMRFLKVPQSLFCVLEHTKSRCKCGNFIEKTNKQIKKKPLYSIVTYVCTHKHKQNTCLSTYTVLQY